MKILASLAGDDARCTPRVAAGRTHGKGPEEVLHRRSFRVPPWGDVGAPQASSGKELLDAERPRRLLGHQDVPRPCGQGV